MAAGLDLQDGTTRGDRTLSFNLADGSRVTVHLSTTGTKTQIAVEQERLPDAATAARAKAAWRERLTALKTLLEDSG